ncbi:MAG: type III pantothenate kinase [Bacillota bacterium]|jgi:type III pantothenate kinase|nr:type III pantothenate kinase [Bacillota bacterium]NLM07416.1 type III pantothenate kinase [Clostridiales Family XIII bacterium]
MIIAIDVGNTHIVMGCLDKDNIYFAARVSTDRVKTEDEYAITLKNLFQIKGVSPEDVEGGIIASVVPELTQILQLAVKMVIGKTPMLVSRDLDTRLRIEMDAPNTLGADLIVDAVAAIDKYPKPIMIFDMGTATTLSVIDENGTYIGGMIMPGLRLGVDALAARTSKLPRVSLEAPEQLIGKNTVDCIKAGAIFGHAGMLDGLIDRVAEELGKMPTVIATGGLINEIIPYCKRELIYDKHLMLWGLRILYERNKDKQEL